MLNPRLFLSWHGMDYAVIEYAGLPVTSTVLHCWPTIFNRSSSEGEWRPQVLEHREMLHVQRRRLIALHVGSRGDQIVTQANA